MSPHQGIFQAENAGVECKVYRASKKKGRSLIGGCVHLRDGIFSDRSSVCACATRKLRHARTTLLSTQKANYLTLRVTRATPPDKQIIINIIMIRAFDLFYDTIFLNRQYLIFLIKIVMATCGSLDIKVLNF